MDTSPTKVSPLPWFSSTWPKAPDLSSKGVNLNVGPGMLRRGWVAENGASTEAILFARAGPRFTKSIRHLGSPGNSLSHRQSGGEQIFPLPDSERKNLGAVAALTGVRSQVTLPAMEVS